MIRFRKAEAEDLGIIAGFLANPDELFFFHPIAVFPLTKEQLLPNFNTREGNTVIFSGEKLAGFANFISVAEGDYASIGNVAIGPEFRGQGVGRKLIHYMEDKARSLYDVKRILIPCFNTNTRGLIFYHGLGYTPCSGEKRMNQNGDPVFLIHLVKNL